MIATLWRLPIILWTAAMADQAMRSLIAAQTTGSSERVAWILAIGGGVTIVITQVGNKVIELWSKFRKIDEASVQGHLAAANDEISLKNERIRVLNEQIVGLIALKDERIKAQADEIAGLIASIGRKDQAAAQHVAEKIELLKTNESLVHTNTTLTDRLSALAARVVITNSELAHKVPAPASREDIPVVQAAAVEKVEGKT